MNCKKIVHCVATIFFMVVLTAFCWENSYAVDYLVNAATDTGAGSGTSGDLRFCITQLNLSGTTGGLATDNTITFQSSPALGTISLSSDLPPIQRGVTLTIPSGSQTIYGSGKRIFASIKSDIVLTNLALQNGKATGGNGTASSISGGAGGGGGLGAGGGAYIDINQNLTLINTTITSCNATGGNGATNTAGSSNFGGGGGGSWTISKNAVGNVGGGDFPGNNLGTVGAAGPQGYAAPLTTTGYGGGNGGNNFSSTASGGGGGGGGGASNTVGGNGGYCGGGGGSLSGGGGGGGGGNGGGGGGGSGSVGGGGGGFGSGGGGGLNGSGGGGGFGGGGGGGNTGGGGGFGGGGGGTGTGGTMAQGGSFGGAGDSNNGGGGAGIGGGIFVADKATLKIADVAGTATNLSSNTTTKGNKGGGSAADGQTYANDIFLFQAAKLQFTGSTNLSVGFAIQADTNPLSNPDGGVTINTTSNSNVITFTGTSNNYKGGTTITKGGLQVINATLPTTGAVSIASNGTLALGADTVATTGTFSNSGNLNIGTKVGMTNYSAVFTATHYTSFTNTGAVYLYNAGSNFTGANLSGTTLSIGKDSLGNSSGNAFSTSATLNFTSINIYSNSSLTNSGGSITGDLYISGTSNSFSGTINASILQIGQDSFGAADGTTNFTTATALSTIPTINVKAGTFTNSGANTITNVNSAFVVSNGATANLNANFSGTATSASSSNSGNLNLGATFGLASFANNASGIFTIATNGINNTLITNSGTISATGANANNQSTITNNNTLSVTGTLSNSGTINNASTISGAGTLNNTGVIAFSGAATNSSTITNTTGGSITVAGTPSNSGTINNINNATMSGAGTLTNSGTLGLGGTSATSAIINNTGTINVTGTPSNSGSITNSNVISGAGTLSNTGNLTFSGGTSNSSAITNQIGGIFNISGNSSNSAILTNAGGTLTISAAVTNSGSIVISSGTLNLQTGAVIANTITNNGTTAITGTPITSASFSNTGLVTIPATGNLTVGSFLGNTATNSLTINITNTNFGQLNSAGAINLTDTNITITAPPTLASGSWQVITAGSGLLTQAINPPTFPVSSDPSLGWTYAYNANTSLTVSLTTRNISSRAIGPINQVIAASLDSMTGSNEGQNILLAAVYASSSTAELNRNLQNLMPIMNASAPNIATQNAIFDRVETRLANLDQPISFGLGGIAAGECNPTTSLWLGGFGSVAHQYQNGLNFGYIAKGFGSILGLDSEMTTGGTFGIAAAISKTIVDDSSNSGFVSSVIGYHGLFYGTHLMECDKFLEWLFTGAVTDTKGSRLISFSNTVMSTTAQYRGGQGAVRLNYGRNFYFDDYFSFIPVSTLQYVAIYQPGYSEAYSPAALNIKPRSYQQVLTLGAGARLLFPCDDWWLVGTREIRAMGTYDAVSSNNSVTSSFLVGGNNFTITNPPAERLAFKAGIDLSFAVLSRLYVQFSYDYEVRHKYFDHSGTVKLKYLF